MGQRWPFWLAGLLIFLAPLLLWTRAADGEPAPWQAMAEEDAAASGVTYASDEGLTTLYRWSAAGLLRSVDGGLTWAEIGEGLPATLVGSLTLHDVQPGGARTLYALAGPGERRGLYRSGDGGVTFELAYQPLNFRAEHVAVAAAENGPLIALAGGKQLAISRDGGVSWRDEVMPGRVTALAGGQNLWAGGVGWSGMGADGGERWRMAALPGGVTVRSIVAAARGPAQAYILHAGGILRTTDAGDSWQSLDPPASTEITAFAANLLVWQTLYLGDAAGRVWRSDDWGERWQRLETPGNGAIRALFQTADDREHLYAVSGFDLWQLPQTPLVPTPTHTPTATPTATATAAPTATATPTATPAPTKTPQPSETPLPTPTASPTRTPIPTATPTLVRRPATLISPTVTPASNHTPQPGPAPPTPDEPGKINPTPPPAPPTATDTPVPAPTATPYR